MAKFKPGQMVKDVVDGSEGVVKAVNGYYREGDRISPIRWAAEDGFYYDVTIDGRLCRVWEGRLRGRLPDSDAYHRSQYKDLDEILRSVRERETA